MGSLAALLFFAPSARADDLPLTVPVEATMTHWSPPGMALNGQDVSHRILGLGVPSAGQLYGAMIGLDINLTNHDGEGVGGYQSVLRLHLAWSGASGPVSETIGGAPVTVDRGPEMLVEIGFPPLDMGVTYVTGRFRFLAGFEPGWAYLSAKATVQNAAGTSQRGSADAGSLYLHTPIAACLLAHPYGAKNTTLRDGEDVCLTLTPMIFEFDWLQGVSAGLRVDF